MGALLSPALLSIRAQDRPISTFSTGIDVVEVYATVTAPDGQPVDNLTVADFQLTEDGVPQQITTFAAGEFPLAIAVALDRSFSMAGDRLTFSKQAARSFIAALRPDDEVMLLAVGSEVETVQPPARAEGIGRVDWDGIDAWGTTPLYDGAMQALDAIEHRRGRRALVLLSDGVDRDSLTGAGQLIARARESGVMIYPVAIGKERPPVFGELANVSGGRSFFVEDPRRLEAQLAVLARELRTQYLLGYVPASAAQRSEAEPRWHAIQVTTSRPNLRVRARDGYLAP